METLLTGSDAKCPFCQNLAGNRRCTFNVTCSAAMMVDCVRSGPRLRGGPQRE